jgi:hypothetical protein
MNRDLLKHLPGGNLKSKNGVKTELFRNLNSEKSLTIVLKKPSRKLMIIFI